MPRRARFYDILDRRPRPTSTALRKLVITVFERLQALTEKPNPHSRSLWLSDSVRLAIMGAAEAKTCALRSTAAKPTVCPCLGDSEWMDAWSRSLKSSISGSAPITAIARSKAPTARSISCGSTRTDPTGLSRCTQARKFRLSRHNPGSTCVPTGNRLTTYRLIAAAQRLSSCESFQHPLTDPCQFHYPAVCDAVEAASPAPRDEAPRKA